MGTRDVTVADASQPVSGAKSSEFKWNLVISGITAILGYTSVLPVELAAKIVGGLTGTYTVARTALKIAHVFGYAKNIPDAPPLTPGAGGAS